MDCTPLERDPLDFQQPPAAAEVTHFCSRILGPGAVDSAQEITGGLFNSTFLLSSGGQVKWALRVSPKHDDPWLFSNEFFLMRREHSLAPFLAGASALLPKVVGSDFTCTVANRDAVVTEFIDGDNWDTVKESLTDEENEIIWRQLGRAIRAIHEAPAPTFGWPCPEVNFDKWSDFVIHAGQGLISDFDKFGVTSPNSLRWMASVQRGAAILDEITAPKALHGDPWPKNILVKGRGDSIAISGLLDHERGLMGDPMNEWVFQHMNFPAPFWEEYGPRPTGARARFRDLVYEGLIDVQVLLEGKRYRYGTDQFEVKIGEITNQMDLILAEAS